MVKLNYENETENLKIWVDPTTGELGVTVNKQTVKIPVDTGSELITRIKNMQSLFYEEERKKNSTGQRFLNYLGRSIS